MPAEDVPAGNDEDDNVEVSRWGEPKSYDFEVKDHVDLGEALDKGLDFEAGVKLSCPLTVSWGNRAHASRAGAVYADTHTDKNGYTEMYVPYLVNKDSLLGTGQLSLQKTYSTQRNWVSTDGFSLIPTAEVPLTNCARDEIFEEKELLV